MNNKGFTLVELLITLIVLGILVSIAVPSFRGMILRNSVETDRDELFNSFVYARGEAVKRGVQVSVCKSVNLTACDSTGFWHNGWIVYSDNNGDGVIDSGDVILKVHEGLDAEVKIASSINYVVFDSTGRAPGSNADFNFSHSAGASYARVINLSATGRARKG